jgi:hypothetical protein
VYRWLCVVLHVSVVLSLCGCSGEPEAPPDARAAKEPEPVELPHFLNDNKKRIDPDDPSVVYDEPFVQNSGFKIYNGTAYVKASFWVGPKTKLVLPDKDTKVVRHGEFNAAAIYMEKRFEHYGHGHVSVWPIPRGRRTMGCAIKLHKGELLIGTFGEFYYLEGGHSMRLVVHVPRDVQVRRRAGLTGGMGGRAGSERPPELINPAPGEPRPALTEKYKGRPELWLPPTVEDGWHEIPAVPDPQRRAARNAEKQKNE